MKKKLATGTLAAGLMLAGTGTAGAFELPPLPGVPAEATNAVNNQINTWNDQAAALQEQAAAAQEQAAAVRAEVEQQVQQFIETGVPPQLPAPAPVPEVGAHVAEPAPAVESPCSELAKACVDIDGATAWLQGDNGGVTYGPVPISSGMPGYETPRGEQTVSRKVKDEWSRPYNGPMPNSVYFGPNGNDNGVAFHAGDPNIDSHGCIHLNDADSQVFFDTLQPGDIVDVF